VGEFAVRLGGEFTLEGELMVRDGLTAVGEWMEAGEGYAGTGSTTVCGRMAFDCKCGRGAAVVCNAGVDRFVGGRALVTNVGVPLAFEFPAEKVETR
jgi:hypothetical protein